MLNENWCWMGMNMSHVLRKQIVEDLSSIRLASPVSCLLVEQLEHDRMYQVGQNGSGTQKRQIFLGGLMF